jgi:hypothetical protein
MSVVEQLTLGGIFIAIVCIVGALLILKGFTLPKNFTQKERERVVLKRRVAEMKRAEKPAQNEADRSL